MRKIFSDLFRKRFFTAFLKRAANKVSDEKNKPEAPIRLKRMGLRMFVSLPFSAGFRCCTAAPAVQAACGWLSVRNAYQPRT